MVTLEELTDEEATQVAEFLGKTWKCELLTYMDFEGKFNNALQYYVDTMEKIRKGE